jgi:hypothetical protein
MNAGWKVDRMGLAPSSNTTESEIGEWRSRACGVNRRSCVRERESDVDPGGGMVWTTRDIDDASGGPLAEKQLFPDEAQRRPKDWEHEGMSEGQTERSLDQFGHGGID